jgi:thiamine-monophosphate kinase
LSASDTVVTTDLLIEGVHFDLRCLNLADAGYKSLSVNISDIAAMGALPRYAFGTLGVPRGTTLKHVDALLDGVFAAAGEHTVNLAGGDTVAAPQWVIGFTVLGELQGSALTRAGARPGDVLWHSGELGLSQVGLSQLWANKITGGCDTHSDQAGAFSAALAAHRRPKVHVELGRLLQAEQLATACIDTSDSLAQCLLSLADASKVGLYLDFTGYQFPASVAAFAVQQRRWLGGGASAFRVPARFVPRGKAQRFKNLSSYLLASAEDYQLLFTAHPMVTEKLLQSSPVPLACLGRVVARTDGHHYLAEDGLSYSLERVGFEHM